MTIKLNTTEVVDILIALEMRSDYVSAIDITKQERLKKMIEIFKDMLENQYYLPFEDIKEEQ